MQLVQLSSFPFPKNWLFTNKMQSRDLEKKTTSSSSFDDAGSDMADAIALATQLAVNVSRPLSFLHIPANHRVAILAPGKVCRYCSYR